MGGLGSGRWPRLSKKRTTESQLRIDIRWFKKQGYLQPGTTGTVSWSFRGKKAGEVMLKTTTDHLVLDYRYQPYGGDWATVKQNIAFDRTPCYYGGQRTWFLCPTCHRRVALLYWVGKYFRCRHCHHLTYAAQQESKADRLMRKARKLRRRIGASADLTRPILFKPKNMHQQTFDRLRWEAKQAKLLSWLILEQRLARGTF